MFVCQNKDKHAQDARNLYLNACSKHGSGSKAQVRTTIRYTIAARVTTGHVASGIVNFVEEREKEEREERRAKRERERVLE